MHLDDEPTLGHEPSGEHPPIPGVTDVPEPAPPHDRSSTRRLARRTWLAFAAILFLGMITTEPVGGTAWERSADLFAGGLALLLVSVVLACTVCIWRRSTRRRIPGAALLTAVILVPLVQAGEKTEVEKQFAALQDLAADTSNPVDTADTPPEGSDARTLWATRKAMEDMVVHYESVARSHGVDTGTPPEAWLSAAYLADARRHPEVGSYFMRYQAYVREADSTLVPLLTKRMHARLVQSGLDASRVDRIMRGFAREAARRAERQQFASMLQLAEQALELDAYLVRADPRVHLDERTETALFDREAERLHVNGLIERIEGLEQTVDAQQRAGDGRLKDQLNDLGRVFGIEADTADAPAAPKPADEKRARGT
jgi:hypothetical protein